MPNYCFLCKRQGKLRDFDEVTFREVKDCLKYRKSRNLKYCWIEMSSFDSFIKKYGYHLPCKHIFSTKNILNRKCNVTSSSNTSGDISNSDNEEVVIVKEVVKKKAIKRNDVVKTEAPEIAPALQVDSSMAVAFQESLEGIMRIVNQQLARPVQTKDTDFRANSREGSANSMEAPSTIITDPATRADEGAQSSAAHLRREESYGESSVAFGNSARSQQIENEEIDRLLENVAKRMCRMHKDQSLLAEELIQDAVYLGLKEKLNDNHQIIVRQREPDGASPGMDVKNEGIHHSFDVDKRQEVTCILQNVAGKMKRMTLEQRLCVENIIRKAVFLAMKGKLNESSRIDEEE